MSHAAKTNVRSRTSSLGLPPPGTTAGAGFAQGDQRQHHAQRRDRRERRPASHSVRDGSDDWPELGAEDPRRRSRSPAPRLAAHAGPRRRAMRDRPSTSPHRRDPGRSERRRAPGCSSAEREDDARDRHQQQPREHDGPRAGSVPLRSRRAARRGTCRSRRSRRAHPTATWTAGTRPPARAAAAPARHAAACRRVRPLRSARPAGAASSERPARRPRPARAPHRTQLPPAGPTAIAARTSASVADAISRACSAPRASIASSAASSGRSSA